MHNGMCALEWFVAITVTVALWGVALYYLSKVIWFTWKNGLDKVIPKAGEWLEEPERNEK